MLPVVRTLLARVRALWQSNRIHDEIADEIRFHLESRTEEYLRRGMSLEDAREEAQRRFGRSLHIREAGYDVRGGGWIESFVQDLRFGARMVGKNPAVAVVAVVTLALGIGSTTAVFSLVNAILLRPLPVSRPGELSALYGDRRGSEGVGDWSYPHFRELRDRSGSFAGLAAQAGANLSVTIGDRAELLWANIVSEDYFAVLGMTPALGRLLLP